MKILNKIYFPIFILLFTFFVSCSEESETTLTETEVQIEKSLSLISGNGQIGLQHKVLPKPIVLKVTDQRENGLSRIEINAQVEKGNGIILNSELITDSEGILEIHWELGGEVENSIKVSISEDVKKNLTANAKSKYLYEEPELINDGWETASIDMSDHKSQILLDGVDAVRFGEYTKIHSILVVHENKLVLETYFPGRNSQGNFINFNRSTPHEVQSTSKSFRSAMIGIAIDKGFISGVDQKLFSFFPDYAHLNNGNKDKITLEHILTMSSGLEWDEWNSPFSSPNNNLSTMYRLSAPSWARYVLQRDAAFEPGTRWVYNTGASIMLNRMIENASGMAMRTFVETYYSGLIESAVVPGIGYPLHATIIPRDMAKFGYIFLNNGKWKDKQIISKEWIDESIKVRFQVNSSQGYGYQWWTRAFRTTKGNFNSFYSSGNGGQLIIIIKELNLVVVLTGGHFGSPLMSRAFEIVERFIIPGIK